jgi:hypothetical protein
LTPEILMTLPASFKSYVDCKVCQLSPASLQVFTL